MIRKTRILGFLFLVMTVACEKSPDRLNETVVLVHGMGRTRVSMSLLKTRLEKARYTVVNFPYSPHNESLDTITDNLQKFVQDNVQTKQYHLIGHSLGNIIIRNAFKHSLKPGLGRIVMLAPPNNPAYLAGLLKENRLYRWFSGDSGQKLSSPEFYATLPVPTVEFGVIAGDRGQKLTFEEPNDGIVTVESTKLCGMKDWILLHHTHTFMMNSGDTAEQCVHFLQTGNFIKK